MRTSLITLGLIFCFGYLTAQEAEPSLNLSEFFELIQDEEKMAELQANLEKLTNELGKPSNANKAGEPALDSVIIDFLSAGSKIFGEVLDEELQSNSASPDPSLDSTISDLIDVGSRLMTEMMSEMPEIIEGFDSGMVDQQKGIEKLVKENKALRKLLEGSNALTLSVTEKGISHKGKLITLEKLKSEIQHAPSLSIDVDSNVPHTKLVEVLQAVTNAGVDQVTINSE